MELFDDDDDDDDEDDDPLSLILAVDLVLLMISIAPAWKLRPRQVPWRWRSSFFLDDLIGGHPIM